MWLTVYLLVTVSITRCNSLFTSWSWSASPDVTHCLPLGHGQHHPMRLTVYLLVMVSTITCGLLNIITCDSVFIYWSRSAASPMTHCLPLGHAQHYHLWLTSWSCPTLTPVTHLLVMPNIITCDSQFTTWSCPACDSLFTSWSSPMLFR